MTENLKLHKLAELLEINDNIDMVELILTEITNNTVDIVDIDQRGNEYEVFMSDNSAFTGKELNQLYNFFNVSEIGLYGDPAMPNEKVYFHLIVTFP